MAKSGKVAIVTGSATGLGASCAIDLAERGWNVVINYTKSKKEADETYEAVKAKGVEAILVQADMGQDADCKKLAAETLKKWGRIDGLVNNAALMSVLARRPWHEIDVDEWDRVMAVNLRGVFLCSRAVYPHMKKQRAGKIVNISSGRVFEGTPFRLHYTTTKAGIIGMTRAMARELGPDGIAVNALSPGLTLSKTQMASSDPKYLAAAAEGRAFKRAQVPDDLLGTLVYLLSDASNFLTGQTINVDGGRAMH